MSAFKRASLLLVSAAFTHVLLSGVVTFVLREPQGWRVFGGVYRFFSPFAISGWLLSLVLLSRLEGGSARGLSLIAVTGTAVGPLVLGLWCVWGRLHRVRSDWYPNLAILLVGTTVSLIATTIYLLLMKTCSARIQTT